MNNHLRILLVIVLVCTGSLALSAQTQTYVVKPGETIYSISRAHGLTTEQLRGLNPRMGETLYAGQTIAVPARAEAGDGCRCMYEVQRKETVYSIARRFNISEDELRAANPSIKKNKVKRGEWLCIPYSAEQQRALQQQAQQQLQQQAEEVAAQAKRISPINVAVVLPFDLGSATPGDEGLKMLDFYEGFLLAVDELKAQGISVNVYAYDEQGTGTAAMGRITAQPMMPYMHLIIGPLRQENIPALADFSKRRGIPLVVPFNTSATAVEDTPLLFRVNTAAAALYDRVYEMLLPRLNEGNIVFVEAGDGKRQIAFIDGLQNSLTRAGIPFQSVHAATLLEAETFLTTLSEEHTNILIPTSNAQNAFESIVRRLGAEPGYATYRFQLIGYPEWQTFSAANKTSMRKYHATFFATFYTDATSSASKAFAQTFKRWFRRDQFPSYPLYGEHGYDIGQFFLKGIDQWGTDFVDNQSSVSVSALQLPLRFSRQSDTSGFTNTYVRLIDM